MGMRLYALLLVMLALGCAEKAVEEPAAQASTTLADAPAATSTTAAEIRPTATEAPPSTAANQPAVNPANGCAGLNASFWRSLCRDRWAYITHDESLCGTVYCTAYFQGPGACQETGLNSTDWRGYKMRACEAWAAGTPYKCDTVMKSGECIRWYAILQGNLTLCQTADRNGREACASDMAYWRGDRSYCMDYKTAENRLACEAAYHTMAATDRSDPGYCAPIRLVKPHSDCLKAAGYSGRPEGHPLYGIDRQIISR